jgi:outer membrane lipoprotein LolB
VPQGPESLPAEAISGRLSVHVDAAPGSEARNVSAAFELRGRPEAGALDLTTPLGTVMAQAHWSPGAVVLVTPNGERRFPDLASLTQDVLGESIPVEALYDWLRGRAWSGARSAAATPPAEKGFSQLGWKVSLARFDEGWVVAQRDRLPAVVVRAKLDR